MTANAPVSPSSTAQDNIGRPWARRDLYFLLALLLLWALFFWRYLAPDPDDRVSLPAGDFSDHFYVLRSYAYDQLLAGRFPLWGGDGVFSVYPFQADPESALLYPPTIATLLFVKALGLPYFPVNAFLVETFIHVLLASVLCYVFLRSAVRSRWAAVIGSLAFSYGGYLVSYPLLQTSFLEAAVWLPLALFAVSRLSDTGRKRYLVLAGATFTLAFLPGNPQNVMFLVYTTLAYYVYCSWRQRTSWRQVAYNIILMGLLTLGLTAVQLLPSVEWWRHSIRASIPFEMSATGFPPQDVVQFILTGMVSLWQPLYVGILSLALALVAVVCSRQRDIAFWAGLAVIALILSMGRNVFGFEMVYFSLPGMGLFRDQERLAYLVTFALAVLAAHGSDVLLSPMRRPERRFVADLAQWLRRALPVAFLLLLAVIVLRQVGVKVSESGLRPASAAILVLSLGLVTVTLHLRLHRRSARRLLGLLMVLVLVFDLFSLNRARFYSPAYNPHARSSIWQQVLSDPGFFRVQEGDGFPITGSVAGRRQLREVWGVAITLEHYDDFLKNVSENVLWQLLGVKYVVTWQTSLTTGAGAQAEQLATEGEGDNLKILYQLPGEPRPAWIVHQIRLASTREGLYQQLNAPEFEPFGTAVLWESAPVEDGDPAADSVSLTRFEPDRIELSTHLESAGLLVLGEVTYPGWRVYVNGQRSRLYEADGVLRAVALAPGDSEVQFRYRPVTFYAGLAVSALTLLIVLTLGLVGRFGRAPAESVRQRFGSNPSPTRTARPSPPTRTDCSATRPAQRLTA